MDNHVAEQLERMNRTLEGMLEFMKKPENKFEKALTLAGTGVSVMGILHLIDLIINWLGGR